MIKKFLLLLSISSVLLAEDIKIIDSKPNWYTIYCINKTAWIEWKQSNTIIQMFKTVNTTLLVPQSCSQ